MKEPLWERFKAWICTKVGHDAYTEYNDLGGCEPEICARCHRLLSTRYSRGE